MLNKCHLITSSKVPFNIRISDVKVTSESSVKFLGIHIDHRLNFDCVSQLCEKAGKKLHALGRIFKYVETSKRRVFANSKFKIKIFILLSNLDDCFLAEECNTG